MSFHHNVQCNVTMSTKPSEPDPLFPGPSACVMGLLASYLIAHASYLRTSSTTSVPISFPPVHNRLGLGVPVLPPIPHTSSAPHLSHSSELEQPNRPPTPPPPYFAEQEAETRRRPPSHPSSRPTYKLPDPKGSLSIGERKEVESIAAMGFPSPRVGRTVKRLGTEDRTKVRMNEPYGLRCTLPRPAGSHSNCTYSMCITGSYPVH